MAAKQFYLPYMIAVRPTNVGAPKSSLAFYEAGTTTLAVIYSDATLETPLENPVIADGAGRFPTIYLDDSANVRLYLTDKDGALLADIDPYVPGSIVGADDPTLRSELAANAGSTLILHKAADSGTFARSERQWAVVGGMNDANVFNWIDSDLDPDILDRSNTVNLAASIQNGLDHANGLGGGRIHLPYGSFLIGDSVLQMRPNVLMHGDGRTVSELIWTGTGDGMVFQGDVNHSPAQVLSNTNLRDLKLINTNPANTGSGYVDVFGTFVDLNRLWVKGFQSGITFDGTELFHVDLCNIEQQLLMGIWLTNGAGRSPGADVAFTNQGSVTNCQINEAATVYGVVDEGGYVRAYHQNNFNGCLNALRLAGVLCLSIADNEMESNGAGSLIQFASTTLAGLGAGTGVGNCQGVKIANNLMLQGAGHSDIDLGTGVNGLSIEDNYLSTTDLQFKITGSNFAQGFFDAKGNTTNDNSPDRIFDSYAFQLFVDVAAGANNDVPLPALRGDTNGESFICLSMTGTAGAFSITGLVAEYAGRNVLLYNNSGQTLTLAHQNVGSAAANRITTHTGADLSLPNKSSVNLRYDFGAPAWVVTGVLVGS